MQNGSVHETLTPLARQQVGNVISTGELQMPQHMLRCMSDFKPSKSIIAREGGGNPVVALAFESSVALMVDGVAASESTAMASVGLALVATGSGIGGRSNATFFPLVRDMLVPAGRFHPLLQVNFLSSMRRLTLHAFVLTDAMVHFNETSYESV